MHFGPSSPPKKNRSLQYFGLDKGELGRGGGGVTPNTVLYTQLFKKEKTTPETDNPCTGSCTCNLLAILPEQAEWERSAIRVQPMSSNPFSHFENISLDAMLHYRAMVGTVRGLIVSLRLI